MRPLTLELEGFLSYREPTSIDLAGLDAVAILGENGSGKTALLEAITWALYGRARGRGPDAVVNDLSTRAVVTFAFELAGGIYRVRRERHVGKSSKSELRLERSAVAFPITLGPESHEEWAPIGGDSIAETQAAIVDLLGLTEDLFTATAFVGQGDADRFTELRPAARKELLFELLELDRYAVLAGRAHDQAAELKGEWAELGNRLRAGEEDERRLGSFEHLEAELETAERLLGSADEEAGKRAVFLEELLRREGDARAAVAAGDAAARASESLRAARRAEFERLGQEEAGISVRLSELENRSVALSDEISRLTADVRGFTELDGDRPAWESKLAEAEAAMEHERHYAIEHAALAEGARSRIAILSERRDRLSSLEAGSLCPTCEQPIDADHAINAARGIERDLPALDLRLSASEGNVRASHARFEEAQEARRAAIRELEAIAAGVAQGSRLADRLEEARGQQTEITVELERIRGVLAEARERLRILDEPSEEERRLADEGAAVAALAGELDALSMEIGTTRRSIEELEANRGRLAERATVLRERISNALDLRETIKIARARMDELEGEGADLAFLEAAFGRDGIPSMILAANLETLEAEANEILERITAGRYTLRIETERALKAGGTKGSLEIVVGDDTAERPLEALSGGERQAADLALRLGLSRLLSARAGHAIEMLVLDEAFGAFDAGRRQAATELLGALRERFGSVLFVTHERELAEAFGNRIRVDRGPTGSIVTIEGGAA